MLLKTPRRRGGFVLLCILLAGIGLIGPRQVSHAQGQAPVEILPSTYLSTFTLSGTAATNKSVVSVSGQPFSQAWRLTTPTTPTSPYYDGEWSVELRGQASGAVVKGDVLRATFWARLVTGGLGGQGETNLIVQGSSTRVTSGYGSMAFGTSWQQFSLPFVAEESAAGGQTDVVFWLGYAAQTIEIGGLSILNYGPGTIANLPNPPTYAGREAGASWRSAANARIEQIRKGDFTITVTNAAGTPIPNAAVSVAMRRHAFGFGSAVDADLLRTSSADAAIYRAKIRQLFTKAPLRNDLKWGEWEDTGRREQSTLPALLWLQRNAIAIRGHALIWPAWRYIPSDVYGLRNDPAALRSRIDGHISQEVQALAGQIAEWDVVNEPYANHDVLDILGTSEMTRWYQLARQGDAQPKLYINDYDIYERSAWTIRHQDHYYRAIQQLIAEGAPLDGIGFQSHFDWQLTPPEQLLSTLDRFAAFNKPIQVTEFDVNITDEQLQADYTRDFLTAVFSHPSVNGVVMWGFWQGRHWLPDAALYRTDWTTKPNGQVFEDLVFNQWWTNAQGSTNSAGQYTARGFFGDYDITVTANGASEVVRATLAPGGTSLTVVADGVASAPPAPATNLDLNGGFEAGLLTWEDWGGSAVLSAGARSGTQALQLGSGASGRAQTLLDFTPGTSYTLSAWAKLSAGGDNCWVGVRGGSTPGLEGFQYLLPYTTETSYTQKQLSFTPPADTSWLQLFAWKSSGASTCSVDDVSVTQTVGAPIPPPYVGTLPTLPPAATNLLANGGVEGSTRGWYGFGPTTLTLSAVSSPVYAGTGALAVSGRTAAWNGAAQDISGQLRSGTTYRTSAWVRLPTGAAATTASLKLKLVTSAGDQYLTLATGAISGSGWAQLSGTSAISWTGTLQRAEWNIDTASGTADLYLDEALLQPVPPASSNLLANPTIEAGATNWYAFGGGSVAAVTSPVHGGSQALTISGRSAAWQGPAQNITGQVSNGATYSGSVWVRLARKAANTTAAIKLKVVTSTGTSYVTVGSATVNASAWTQVSGTAPLTWTGTLQSVEWYVDTASGTATFTIDDADFRRP